MKFLFPLLIFFFIQTGGSVYGQDIFDAVRKGDLTKIDELVKLNPDTVNARNSSGFTPLIIAAYRNQVEAVKFLLDHKADVNASSPEGPVILGVCYKGDRDLAALLIAKGADVNAQNSNGTTALIYATLANTPELVELLLKHGAKKELAEKSGRTALSIAQANNSQAIVALLQGP